MAKYMMCLNLRNLCISWESVVFAFEMGFGGVFDGGVQVRRFLAGFYSRTTILVVVSYGPSFFHHGDYGGERFDT